MGVDLSVTLGKIKMANPVMVSSGTFGCGSEYGDLVDVNSLGAIVTKTVTLKPRSGNPPPRIAESASGMLNAIGLENIGIDRFIEEKLPYLRSLRVPVIISIAGDTVEEYVCLAERLNKEKAAALELNISCPNVKSKKGRMFSQDKEGVKEVVSAARRQTKATLIVKLSPNVTDIKEIAMAAEEAGADVISLVNTFGGMLVDIEKKVPKLGNVTGGLSGPAIKPIALRMVYEAASCVDIPVVGQGGIMNWEDALEFIIVGADAVSIGTANFIDPRSTFKILEGIKKYMAAGGLKEISRLVGTLKISRE